MEKLVVNTGWISLISFIGILVSWAIWFLIRKRRFRVWMPILRVVDIDSKPLPKMTVTPPPWLAFLCFLFLSILLLFFTVKPRNTAFAPFEPNRTHIHIFFDMSPSLAIRGKMPEYTSEVESLILSVKERGRLTFSTSHSREVYDLGENADVVAKLTELGFHRHGLKLGDSIRQNLQDVGDIDQLLVFSDGNQYSWNDFNWSFLEEEIDVRLVKFEGANSKPSNYYINGVTPKNDDTGSQMEWDVEIVRSGLPVATNGTITVHYDSHELYVGSWVMPENRNRIELRVRWPHHKFKMDGSIENVPLVWKIFPDNEETGLLDNEFRSLPSGMKQSIMLMADPNGEQFLEDPAHHLMVSLDILGFSTKRYDFFPPQKEALEGRFPVWVVMAGLEQSSLGEQCPKWLGDGKKDQGVLGNQNPGSDSIVWLVPIEREVHWKNMCVCLARFSQLSSGKDPEFCDGVESRDQYVGILASIGAKQVGGALGNAMGAVAWHFKNKNSHREILAFTSPLRPDLRSGISYSNLPILTKVIVGWQKLSLKDKLGFSSWPRYESTPSQSDGKESLEKSQEQSRASNVPLGESLVNILPRDSLPKKWDPLIAEKQRALNTKKDMDDPMPWIRFMFIGAIGLLGLEAVILGGKLLLNLAFKRTETLLLLLGFVFFSDGSQASVKVNLLGYSSGMRTAKSLSREVASRTSIDLSTRVKQSREFSPTVLKEPWIWVRDHRKLFDEAGYLRVEVSRWLKRGGLLVLENINDDSILEKIRMTGGFLMKPEEGWKAIPPDHEVMRSFHLLESLPTCSERVWKGFRFDGRIAIFAIPGDFMDLLVDQKKKAPCKAKASYERVTRVFINILMVALTTDYKKDQIHLPEILKRLR